MSKFLLISAAICMTACSQRSESAQTANLGVPAKFTLKCGAPTGAEIPEPASHGFMIAVDRSRNSFSLPWEASSRQIAKLEADQIIFAREHVSVGVDGSPEDRTIIFDRRTGNLHYQEAYSAFVPVNRIFSAHCEILDA